MEVTETPEKQNQDFSKETGKGIVRYSSNNMLAPKRFIFQKVVKSTDMVNGFNQYLSDMLRFLLYPSKQVESLAGPPPARVGEVLLFAELLMATWR